MEWNLQVGPSIPELRLAEKRGKPRTTLRSSMVRWEPWSFPRRTGPGSGPLSSLIPQASLVLVQVSIGIHCSDTANRVQTTGKFVEIFPATRPPPWEPPRATITQRSEQAVRSRLGVVTRFTHHRTGGLPADSSTRH